MGEAVKPLDVSPPFVRGDFDVVRLRTYSILYLLSALPYWNGTGQLFHGSLVYISCNSFEKWPPWTVTCEKRYFYSLKQDWVPINFSTSRNKINFRCFPAFFVFPCISVVRHVLFPRGAANCAQSKSSEAILRRVKYESKNVSAFACLVARLALESWYLSK